MGVHGDSPRRDVGDAVDWTGGGSELGRLAARYEAEGVDVATLSEPFLEASELGDASCLKARLAASSPDERRALVRSVDQQGRSGLVLAARAGDPDVARVLLDNGANPNDADSAGCTPLHYAAAARRAEVVEYLLHCKADPDKANDQGETVLFWAAGRRTAGALLAARADPTARAQGGSTPLIAASSRGDCQCVLLLAAACEASLNARDDLGRTAASAARAAGHDEICATLAAQGAAPPEDLPAQEVRLVRASEALHFAVRHGNVEMCRQLLGDLSPAEIDAEVGGETPLLAASAIGAGCMMEMLLDARADPNRKDAYLKESPLMRAVLHQCSDEALLLLLEARADPLAKDITGRTPLSVAGAWGLEASKQVLAAYAAGCPGPAGRDG